MHKYPSIKKKCGHIVEPLPWCYELDVDSCGSKYLVFYVGISMLFLDSSKSCFHANFMSTTILVHTVVGSHILN